MTTCSQLVRLFEPVCEQAGVYQIDGRVLESTTKRAISVVEFVTMAGVTSKQPLRAILLKSSVDDSAGGGVEATSLEDLLQVRPPSQPTHSRDHA